VVCNLCLMIVLWALFRNIEACPSRWFWRQRPGFAREPKRLKLLIWVCLFNRCSWTWSLSSAPRKADPNPVRFAKLHTVFDVTKTLSQKKCTASRNGWIPSNKVRFTYPCGVALLTLSYSVRSVSQDNKANRITHSCAEQSKEMWMITYNIICV
jgi:hypothetical protein